MSKENNDQSISESLMVLKGVGELAYSGLKNFRKFVEMPEIQNLLQVMVKGAVLVGQYTIHQQNMMKNMSLDGWFPSYLVFKNLICENETLDEYMERCLDPNLDQILGLLVHLHPLRAELFKDAFDLISRNKHNAAIPMLFSQIDGICEDAGFSPYFTDNHNADKSQFKNDPDLKLRSDKFIKYIKHILDGNLIDYDKTGLEFYRDVISNAASSFILKSTNKIDFNVKNEILNRHGILHGDKRFLNYGSKTNALKVVSLLLFVESLIALLKLQDDSNEGLHCAQ